MSRILLFSCAVVFYIAVQCYATSTYQACLSGHDSYKFCDTTMSIEDRVADLLSQLTVTEKINQMGNSAQGVSRLGIPAYQWWTEALHGLNSMCYSSGATQKCPTSFPAGLNMAASFNMDLVYDVGAAISDEVRAAYNLNMRTTQGVVSANIWTPNINIFRDPRWGRGQETPGEDPYLSSRFAASFISGLQDTSDSSYWKVAATAKHFACYSLEVYDDVNRVQFDANVTQQDLFQTFFPAFESAVVNAEVHGIMCSYNSINGVPSCANEDMLMGLLREKWGFEGYVTGDCWALAAEVDGHHYVNTTAEAAAVSIHAGTDLDCITNGWYNLNTTLSSIYELHLQDAINQGLVSEADIDVNLGRLYTVQMHLGLFDPVANQPYQQLNASVIDSAEHRALAHEMGRESIILLKNEDLLPLVPDVSAPLKVAVIGPHHASTTDLCSNYFFSIAHVVSVKEAFQNASGIAPTFTAGCTISGTDVSGIPAAVAAAKAAEVAVLVVGINGQIEGEELDRYDVVLPGVQNQLIAQVLAAQPNTVIVIVNGGMVGFETINTAPAIVEALYPGEEGGNAIVDVLLGRYNPSGRLPYTIYPSTFIDEADFFNFHMRQSPGLTYRFYQKTPVYPFGYGLSYTTFSYSIVGADSQKVAADLKATVNFTVSVKNTGAMAGDVSVLGFIALTTAASPSVAAGPYVDPACPLKQLFAFDKVSLAVGESVSIPFAVSPASAFCFDDQGNAAAIAGTYTVTLGDATATLTVGSARRRHSHF